MELLIRARNSVGRVPMKALYGDENEAQDVEYKKFYYANWNKKLLMYRARRYFVKVSLPKAAKICTLQNAV